MADEVEVVKLSTLVQDDHNANKGTERGAEMIRESLKKYGAGRSILLDRHGVIIAGNKTALNATAIGMDDVIVVKTDGSKIIAVQREDLDLQADPKARELAIADNRASEVSLNWDVTEIATLLQDPSIDMGQFFNWDELRQLHVPAELLPNGPLNGDEDEVPDVPATPVSQAGDLYILGEHRLYCGDSTDPESFKRVLGDGGADMCWTDPPYNVAYEGKTADALTIQNDSMSDAEFESFLDKVYRNLHCALQAGGTIYVAHADSYGHLFRGSLIKSGLTLRQCLVWVKNSMVMGRQDYHWQHEPILYGWKPGAAHRWFSDRKQTTILSFDRPTRSTEHPTMKPVGLVEYCIANSSVSGDVVIDPFGGSGTTLIACEKTHRKARLIELDPRYVDVIAKRWSDLTGKTPRRFNAAGEELAVLEEAAVA